MKIKALVNSLMQECINAGVDWKDVDVLFRRSDDSDVELIGRVEQDLFDAKTNRRLTSVMLFPTKTRVAQRTDPIWLIDKGELESILDCAEMSLEMWHSFHDFILKDKKLIAKIDQMVLEKAREWANGDDIVLPL